MDFEGEKSHELERNWRFNQQIGIQPRETGIRNGGFQSHEAPKVIIQVKLAILNGETNGEMGYTQMGILSVSFLDLHTIHRELSTDNYPTKHGKLT